MEKTFQPGEKIIREGESGTSAFWLKKGRVEVSREFDGHHIVLAILDKHSPLFGEMSLIDEKPRSATVTAIEPCVVEEITAELLHQDLDASSRPVQLLIGMLVDRVRGMNEHVLACGVSLVQTPIRAVTLSGFGKGAEALNQRPLLIERFPFKIGRKSSRGLFSLGQRNLELADEPPFNVSRAHCSITRVTRTSSSSMKAALWERSSMALASEGSVRAGRFVVIKRKTESFSVRLIRPSNFVSPFSGRVDRGLELFQVS